MRQSETGSEELTTSVFVFVVAASPPQPAKDANEIAARRRVMRVVSMFITEPRSTDNCQNMCLSLVDFIAFILSVSAYI
jgi:hypothetical protein